MFQFPDADNISLGFENPNDLHTNLLQDVLDNDPFNNDLSQFLNDQQNDAQEAVLKVIKKRKKDTPHEENANKEILHDGKGAITHLFGVALDFKCDSKYCTHQNLLKHSKEFVQYIPLLKPYGFTQEMVFKIARYDHGDEGLVGIHTHIDLLLKIYQMTPQEITNIVGHNAGEKQVVRALVSMHDVLLMRGATSQQILNIFKNLRPILIEYFCQEGMKNLAKILKKILENEIPEVLKNIDDHENFLKQALYEGRPTTRDRVRYWCCTEACHIVDDSPLSEEEKSRMIFELVSRGHQQHVAENAVITYGRRTLFDLVFNPAKEVDVTVTTRAAEISHSTTHSNNNNNSLKAVNMVCHGSLMLHCFNHAQSSDEIFPTFIKLGFSDSMMNAIKNDIGKKGLQNLFQVIHFLVEIFQFSPQEITDMVNKFENNYMVMGSIHNALNERGLTLAEVKMIYKNIKPLFLWFGLHIDLMPLMQSLQNLPASIKAISNHEQYIKQILYLTLPPELAADLSPHTRPNKDKNHDSNISANYRFGQ